MLGKTFLLYSMCVVSATQIPCPLDSEGAVDLSNKGLSYIDDDTFRTIYDCDKDVVNITSIDLSNNAIIEVDSGSFEIFYELRRLNLSNNNISSLENDTFTSLKNLESLDVSFNAMTKLKAGLISLVNLKEVWFNNNNISEVDSNIVGQDNVELIFFNMNNNSLTYFDPWPYVTYQTNQRGLIREFYFQHNNIRHITNYMNWTYDMQYHFEVLVNLQYNEIQTISLETLRQFDSDLVDDSIFAAFLTYQANITNNLFFCDCNLYPLTSIVRRGIFRYSRVEEYRYRCGAPALVEGVDFLHDLSLDKLVCNITTDCPSGCHCEDRPHNDTFFIDCSNAGLTEMPDVIPQHSRSKIEMILDKNNITSLKNTSYLSKVYNISLVGNKLEILDIDVLKQLDASRLDFRDNRISSLPEQLRKYIYSSVFLTGNPLRCDCSSMWLVDWLVLDSDVGDTSITCDAKTGNHRIIDMTLKALGCTNELLIIICCCLGVVFVMVVILLIVAKRCPYETRVIINKLFRIRIGNKYAPGSEDNKEVDIYMVYDVECEDVRGWVRYFLKKLSRKKPVYSVLNPARFMEPGAESENISKWIGKSRTVIVVLSDKMFQNSWRCHEIDEAERRSIEAAKEKNMNTQEVSLDIEDIESHDFDNVDANEQGACAMTEEDENQENAPKIIYIIFNSSDLLKANLDEDKWIERVGQRRELRKMDPKGFDKRAKGWHEKLQQEPWKSRLAGKAVLSPDDRMFWSKLRYELPPTGTGEGDGNFIFKPETCVKPQAARPRDETDLKVARLQANNDIPRVHKKHNRSVKNKKDEKCKPTKCEHMEISIECLEQIDDTEITLFPISEREDYRRCEHSDTGKINVTDLGNTNRSVNAHSKIPETHQREKQVSKHNNGKLLKSVQMGAFSKKIHQEENATPGSGDSRHSQLDPNRRIHTITQPESLRYSRAMRSETTLSSISSTSSSSN